MKIVIPGGSGYIGTILARELSGGGHEVVVLSRTPQPAPWRMMPWDGRTVGAWASEIDGAEVVINLAGRSVNCRYTEENRREILESRVASTEVVGEAIWRAAHPPRLWLQASTATIYAHRFDGDNDEEGGEINREHWPFSIDVAEAWEEALDASPVDRTRKVKMRSAIVLGPGRGGPFDILRRLVRRGLGGRVGDGRQFVSWVHHRDFVRAVRWLIEHDTIDGAVNIAAPETLPNAEFMRMLRSACGVPIGLPASGWILSAGAFLMRTESELVLKSRRVFPRRLLDSGFEFEFNHWCEAARDLCALSHDGRQW